MSQTRNYIFQALLFPALLCLPLLVSACQKNSENTDIIDSPASSETEIAAGDLKGLYVNAGPASPVVLIVPGSGPTDRDGNGPHLQTNMYKQLAQGLSEKGISTVRVDKRGMFSSEAAGDGNAVTTEIYAADYQNWIDHIKSETGRSCIYLLGHSEGGIMVSKAAINRDDVCGLILAAVPGRPLNDLLREQLNANPANKPVIKDAYAAISKLEAGEKVDVSSMHPALQQLFAPPVQGFLISVMAVDPFMLVKDAGKPLLILQGDNDIQVKTEDAIRLSGAPDSKLVILEGSNHLFKQSPRLRLLNLATYKNPDLPIDPKMVDAISDFIKSQP